MLTETSRTAHSQAGVISAQTDTSSDAKPEQTKLSNENPVQPPAAKLAVLKPNSREKGVLDQFFEMLRAPESEPFPETTLEPSVGKDGKISVKTKDGYKIQFTGEKCEWAITSPDGRTTRIWGDPHVVESDGDKWDFTERSSLKFGDNKITVHTKKLENGTSVTDTVTIYNAKDRITITEIDENKPRIKKWSLDADSHDRNVTDGNIYSLKVFSSKSESWVKENDEPRKTSSRKDSRVNAK